MATPPQIQPDINPQYQPELEVFYDQPLLRGFGKEVNLAPIAVARVASQQSAWEFKQSMLAMVRSVEQRRLRIPRADREANRTTVGFQIVLGMPVWHAALADAGLTVEQNWVALASRKS